MAAEGLIELRRGRITLLDRSRIMSRSCECYAALRSVQAQLLGPH